MMLRLLTLIGLLSLDQMIYAQASSSDDFAPVVFTSFESTIPDEKAAAVIESLTRNLRTTFVDVYATELIGSMSEYSPELPPAVLGSSGYALGEMDRTIEVMVMPEIKPVLNSLSDGQRILIKLELLWADSSKLNNLPAASMANSALVSALRISGHQEAAGIMSLRMLDADVNDSDGAIRKSLQTSEMLDRIAAANKGHWLPWTSLLTFVIDHNGIRLNQNVLMIPSNFYKSNRVQKPGVFINGVSYAPLQRPIYPDGHRGASDLANVKFTRYYSASDRAQEGEMRLTFGQWKDNSFKTVESARCVNMVERVPTIHGRVVFEESTWWGSVVGWLRSWVVKDIGTKILLQDLSIAYDRDTHRFKVDPSKSVIPIVVTSDDVFSGGKPYVLDTRSGVFGINLYERFVGSQITDGLTADLNKTLMEADGALSQTIMGLAVGVVQ